MKKAIKRITAMILAASVVFSSGFVSQAASNPYDDVYESDWYYDSVMYVRDKGAMTGVNATHFAPGENLQRQDFALALMRRYISQGHTVTQKDDGTYYGKAVAWAKDMKIMTGYSNGDFGVGDVITRQDCIVALDRYVDACGLIRVSEVEDPYYFTKMEQFKTTYADVDQLRDYSRSIMYVAVMNDKLITGVERGGVKYLEPNGLVTRGMVSVMLERWFEEYGKYGI